MTFALPMCALCTAVLLAACSNGDLPGARARVMVQIVNKTSRDMENTNVVFGENIMDWGIVAKGGSKSFGNFPHRITPVAELRWDEVETRRIERINMAPSLPEGRKGRIVFTVYLDRVEAKFQPDR